MNFCKRLEREQAELLVAGRTYNSSCLIGNWPGEVLLQEVNKLPTLAKVFYLFQLLCLQEKLQEFLGKRERGELLSQKTTKVVEHLLAPVQLTAPKTYVEFDAAIQLIACKMPNSISTLPLALSIAVNEPQLNTFQEIDRHCTVTCAPTSRPCTRNTFIIRHGSHKSAKQCSSINNNASQFLKYGQEFSLECLGSKQKPPLLLYSSVESPFEPTSNYVFKANGMIKQSVALGSPTPPPPSSSQLTQSTTRANVGNANSPAGAFCLWRCYHTNPDLRFETIGESIPVCTCFLVWSID